MPRMDHPFVCRSMSIWISALLVVSSVRCSTIKSQPLVTVNGANTKLNDSQFRIEYDNHPFARHLEEEVQEDIDTSASFEPIRITVHTRDLEKERNEDNGAKIDLITSTILPHVVDIWRKALSVIPVKDNLMINKGGFAMINKKYCLNESTEVPDEHFNVGIADTDLVLYVSASNLLDACVEENARASAHVCDKDQYDRPTAGQINFCLDKIMLENDDADTEMTKAYAVHEVAHVLGMDVTMFPYFYDSETGTPRTERPLQQSTVTCTDGETRELKMPGESTMKFVEYNGVRHATIVTPRVKQVAINQFDCQTLEGAPLEDHVSNIVSCFGNDWDERFFYSELLSNIESGASPVLSPLTLALLEDSGWYVADYTQSKVSPFGHGAGCDFLSKPCIVADDNSEEAVAPHYSRGYFCVEKDVKGCSPSHTHKAECAMITNLDITDERFQYFPGKQKWGGQPQMDYCPLYDGPQPDKPYELDCRISDNAPDTENLYSEEYGSNSMCFETTVEEAKGNACYKATCMEEDFNLVIEVNGKELICEEDFEIVTEKFDKKTEIEITCPRLSSACPDMFCPYNCAGRGMCNYKATVNGKIRPKCECNDSNDTSKGCNEVVQDAIQLNSSAFESSIGNGMISKVFVFRILVILYNAIF